MRCDDLTAFLGSQTGFLKRLALRAHLIYCARCRQRKAEWLCLSRDISRLEGEPVPQALTERLMADAMTAAADARSRLSSSSSNGARARKVSDLKKALAVAGCAAVLIVTGLWLFPRGAGNYVLADVVRAMASVKSVHFEGWFLDEHTGDRRKLEGWLRGPDKYRMIEEGCRDQAIDGNKATTITLNSSEPEALVQPAGDVEPEISLAMFRSKGALEFVMKHARAEVTGSRASTLDGRHVVVTEMSTDRGRALIYADADSDLIARFELYRNGELSACMETFDYDTSFPESVFSPAIPEGVSVIDMTASASQATLKWRNDQRMLLTGYERAGVGIWRFKGPGLHMTDVFAGREERAPHHPDFTFKALKTAQPGRNSAEVFYLPDKNVYRVLGAVRIKGPNGFSRVVEDGDIELPGSPRPRS